MNLMLKRKILNAALCSIVLISYGCTHCKECANNLIKYKTQFSSNYNGEIIEYINTQSVIRKYIIQIEYTPPEKEYNCYIGEDESYYHCSGKYIMTFGDFYNKFYQEQNGNDHRNLILHYAGLGKSIFDFKDTVDYKFNNIEIKAQYYQKRDTTTLEKDYFDFYLSLDNKLLQYRIKDGTTFEVWKLNEK